MPRLPSPPGAINNGPTAVAVYIALADGRRAGLSLGQNTRRKHTLVFRDIPIFLKHTGSRETAVCKKAARSDAIPACDRQTAGRTDRQSDTRQRLLLRDERKRPYDLGARRVEDVARAARRVERDEEKRSAVVDAVVADADEVAAHDRHGALDRVEADELRLAGHRPLQRHVPALRHLQWNTGGKTVYRVLPRARCRALGPRS